MNRKHRPIQSGFQLGNQQQERWSKLLAFLAQWGRPIEAGDGVSLDEIELAERRLGYRLPTALREWIVLSGRRSSDEVSKTNTLRLPEQLQMYEGALVFYDENQSVVDWGILETDLTLDDPPVYIEGDYVNVLPRPGWIEENKSLSQFIFQMEVMDTVAYSTISIRRRCDKALADIIRAKFRSCGFPSWHWPKDPTELYEGSGILIELIDNSSFVLAARSEVVLSQTIQSLEQG